MSVFRGNKTKMARKYNVRSARPNGSVFPTFSGYGTCDWVVPRIASMVPGMKQEDVGYSTTTGCSNQVNPINMLDNLQHILWQGWKR